MEGESNTEAVKIDMSEDAKSETSQIKGRNSYANDEKSKAESWVDQVKRKYESTEYRSRKSSPRVSIYRVPESIKKTKPEAYDPLVVFLGPFRHNKHKQLTAADEYKLQAVGRTLERLHGMTIERLVENVGEVEKEIRDCYEDSAIECDGYTLAWIMTVDACFILEFLRMELPDSSLVFHSRREFNIKRREIISDIMKLENQIPLFLLKRILKLELMSEDRRAVSNKLTELLRSVGWYFEGFPFSLGGYDKSELPRLIEEGAHHLLDLSRQVIADFLSNPDDGSESANSCGCKIQCGVSSCIATSNGTACFRRAKSTAPPSSTVQESFIPSAEKLKTARIKLKASKGKLDFKRKLFGRSTLLVPQITVEDDTEILLRNLVAFEECQMHDGSRIQRVISCNMWIMDQLIDSKEDVQLLQRANIIMNYLGTEDQVAKIFNDLCIGITSANDFNDVSRNVSDHFKSWENLKNTMKEFQESRCPNTWYIVSFVVAAGIFVMSLLQTIYTMKSYYQS